MSYDCNNLFATNLQTAASILLDKPDGSHVMITVMHQRPSTNHLYTVHVVCVCKYACMLWDDLYTL